MDELQTDLEKSYHCHALNMDYINMFAKVKEARKPIFKQFPKYSIDSSKYMDKVGEEETGDMRLPTKHISTYDQADTRVSLPGYNPDILNITDRRKDVINKGKPFRAVPD